MEGRRHQIGQGPKKKGAGWDGFIAEWKRDIIVLVMVKINVLREHREGYRANALVVKRVKLVKVKLKMYEKVFECSKNGEVGRRKL